MQRIYIALAAGMVVACAPGLRAQDPVVFPGMPVEQQVTSWLKANLNDADPQFRQKIADFMQQKMQAGQEVVLDLGQNTTKNHTAVELAVVGKALYAFPLSMEQAMKILEGPDSVTARDFKPGYTMASAPTIRLALPTLASGGSSVQGSGKVEGKVACLAPQAPGQKLALRLTYRIETNTTQKFQYLDSGPSQGLSVLDFSFGPINDKDDKAYTGPLALFIDLATIEQNAGGEPQITVISSPVALMVNVK